MTHMFSDHMSVDPVAEAATGFGRLFEAVRDATKAPSTVAIRNADITIGPVVLPDGRADGRLTVQVTDRATGRVVFTTVVRP